MLLCERKYFWCALAQGLPKVFLQSTKAARTGPVGQAKFRLSFLH